MPEYSERFFRSGPLRIHFRDWGNPEAPPLLIVPPLTMTTLAPVELPMRGEFTLAVPPSRVNTALFEELPTVNAVPAMRPVAPTVRSPASTVVAPV